jgi:hypothetical protein
LKFYKNIIVSSNNSFVDVFTQVNEALKNYKVVHITVHNYHDDNFLMIFYDKLTEKLGCCQKKTEDGRTNKIIEGKWYEVCFDPNVKNAFRHSKNHQPLHTDFSYISPSPNFTLMYCLKPAPSGGETVFIDGNELKSIMINQCPELFKLLVNKSFSFKKTFVNSTRKRVEKVIDDSKLDVRLNWNYYCIDQDQSSFDIDILEQFQDFLESSVMFKCVKPILLNKGEAVIWHDHLVMHGRNFYEAENIGDRHLMKTQVFWKESLVC